MSNNRRFKWKDCFYVILYTTVLSVLFGIILAFVDYYLQTSIDFTFANLLYLVIAIYIGKTVRKVIENPHPVYSVIAGMGMVVSWVIIVSMPTLYGIGLALNNPLVIFNINYYLQSALTLFSPLTWIHHFSINLLLTLLIFVVGTYLGISRTTR